MPFFCKKYYSVFPLKTKWEYICRSNDAIKPTQYYDYFRHLFKAFYHHPSKAIRHRPCFFYLLDGRNECIIPVIIYNKKKTITGFSHYGRLDYEDVISTTQDISFISQCLKVALSNYEGFQLMLSHINEGSILYGATKEMLHLQEQCVTIPLSNIYEQYLERVSKHQRQNIRTAYNKLEKENFKIKLEQYDQCDLMPHKLWNLCEQIYEQRHDEKLGKWETWFVRLTNPYHKILTTNPDRLSFVLFHEGEIMAYMAGLYNEGQSCYYVPRLCINNQFAKYSPGILLINETIKVLIKQGIQNMDLMQGDEPYKIAMGGIPINNYQLHCVWQGLTTE